MKFTRRKRKNNKIFREPHPQHSMKKKIPKENPCYSSSTGMPLTGYTLNSCNEKAFRERFRVYQQHNNNNHNINIEKNNNTNNNSIIMPSKTNTLSGKIYLSCGNLLTTSSSNSVKPISTDITSSTTNIYSRRASHKMKTALSKDDSITRPKSLQQLHDDLLPLLEAASSLSSIGSYNELTEESLLESSYSDDSNKNVLVRRGGKLRNIKHRPHSFALCDHNLVSIPENIFENSLKKRQTLYIQSLNNIQKCDNSLKEVAEDDEENENQDPAANINNINNNNYNNIVNSENEKNRLNKISNFENLENIAVPRRRFRSNNNNRYNNNSNNNGELTGRSTSCCELSFSKEQKKKLKQKMRDTKKSPEKSVFLGLF